MEPSLSSLAYKGSILDAIAESKRQKKLFVVYTAGDNPESKLLETSSWTDPKVSEMLSKYCILLHVLEGSSEASNFSAIYPQHSAPCITAIGYNGVQLWQKDGFVNADVLASSLEKAWLSLHVQETTAAFLTAALASGKQLASGTSETAVSEQVAAETGLTHGHVISPDAAQPLHSQTSEDVNNYEDAKETESKRDGVHFPEPSPANVSDNGEFDDSIARVETGSTSQDPVEIGPNNPLVASPIPEAKLCSSNVVSGEIVSNSSEVAHVNTGDSANVEKADASDSSSIKSTDVFLNIRLPDGSSIQDKFSETDTLKLVKDYIIDNQTSSVGSFSIAIPYPRKIFSDQDLDSTLSELRLLNRQALVVVPENNQNKSSHSQTYSSNDAGSSNASEGYWASVRRILSYVNPLSYLGRGASSSSATEEPQRGIWEYGGRGASSSSATEKSQRGIGEYDPNIGDPELENMLYGGPQSRLNSSGRSNARQQTSRFGGNIHTLRDNNDDDSRFDDRNAFWNGNSTQFGSNDDGK